MKRRALSAAERLDWCRLARSENIGPITFFELLRHFGTASAALDAVPEMAQRGGRRRPIKLCSLSAAEREVRATLKRGARLIGWIEPDYPLALAAIPGPPPLITVQGHGHLLGKDAVAIVGARNASANGKRFTAMLAAELGAAGYVVISGLARGIDAAAHGGALESGTIAVLAGGVDNVYPTENQALYDNIIEIKAVARDPGSRAKIAVFSNDVSIDPVGACVGMRGSRVQAVVSELQGEKIDIIQWSPDPATFIVNALAPAEVTKVVLDEEARRIEVVVPDEQLSLAIGRRGQNVRLASQLSGWDIDILTEAEESERRQEEFVTRSQMFIDCLDVDEVIAQLLVSEGFARVEEVAFVALEEMAVIEGFDEDLAEELANRAKAYIAALDTQMTDRRRELGVEDAVAEIEGVSAAMLVTLGEKEIRTLDDLGDLAGDELIEILGDLAPSTDDANTIIMAARAHWFDDEPDKASEGSVADVPESTEERESV